MFEVIRPEVAVIGGSEAFPVRRIYCVGQNYAAHAIEVGSDPGRQPPFFFMKPGDAIIASGSTLPYPPRTVNLHHEIELVAAIGTGGSNIAPEDAGRHVYGYAVGIDLTRRDLQNDAKKAGRPWATSKGFDRSAPVTAIHPAARMGHPSRGRIWLSVNGELRQDGDLAEMIWSIPEIVAELSAFFTLQPGDLIFTGTPAGVGPLQPGDCVTGGVAGVDSIRIDIAV